MVTWGPGTKTLQDWGLSHPILPVSSPAKILSKSEGNLEGGAIVLVTALVLTAGSMSVDCSFPSNSTIVSYLRNFDQRILGKLCLNDAPSRFPFLVLCSLFISSCCINCYKIVDTIPSMENCSCLIGATLHQKLYTPAQIWGKLTVSDFLIWKLKCWTSCFKYRQCSGTVCSPSLPPSTK